MPPSSEEISAGRKRLKELLPEVRAQVGTADTVVLGRTPLDASVLARLTEDNLDSLVIYEEPRGKWYADLHLKNMPLGVPGVLGTPVETPHATRAAAEAEGIQLLTGVLTAIETGDHGEANPGNPDTVVFQVFQTSFQVPSSALKMAAIAGSMLAQSYSEEDAINYFERELVHFTNGQSFDVVRYEAASSQRKTAFFSAMTLMLLFGNFAYPFRKDGRLN